MEEERSGRGVGEKGKRKQRERTRRVGIKGQI